MSETYCGRVGGMVLQTEGRPCPECGTHDGHGHHRCHRPVPTCPSCHYAIEPAHLVLCAISAAVTFVMLARECLWTEAGCDLLHEMGLDTAQYIERRVGMQLSPVRLA
jgi:hypothetical protein